MVQHHRRRQDLSILNETPFTIKGPTLLHELVPLSSDVSAIEFLEHGSKRRKFSYQRLHALSDIVAKRIIKLTATLGHASAIVPVLLPQCPELYIVLLGILKAGRAFCPLNLDIPEERLRFILKDVSADLLITNTGHSSQVRSIQEVHTLCVDHELLSVNQNDTTSLPHIDTTDLAYVMYTSGSTGLPKAVSVSHRAVTQSLLAHDIHVPDFARFLQFAAPTFDVSIFEIFFPWFRGRTLVSCSRTQMLQDLPGTIRTLEADAAELTPTVVGNLLQGRSSVPGLNLLLTIGEMLTQHVVDEYGSNTTRKGILWAMYGPTEAAIHCTLQAQFNTTSSTGNIGYPLDTVSTFIAAPPQDVAEAPDLTLVPWGEEGELVLGGQQIAEEYLNRPEITATSFIDHPRYGRLYRTGDRARFCEDGTIECLGRIVAGQVKLRGQRVELGEVEQIIMKVEGCRMALATIINDTLVAFCATGSRTVSRTEVLQVCKSWLPSFMIPSDVFMVPTMPQLPSGKIDKKFLEFEYSQSLRRHTSTDLRPSDHTTLTILRLTQDCVGQDLSLNSDLAASGLDSLQAIRIASKLRAEGYDLGAVDVLALPTLRDLVTACKNSSPLDRYAQPPDQSLCPDNLVSIPDLGFDESDVAYMTPCTPLQEAMLAETTLRPNAYCNWIELELSETRTFDEVSAAIVNLARENDILRSGFFSSMNGNGSYVQITWKDLHKTQVRKVSRFQRSYALDSAEALLRPLRIQIQDDLNHPRMLVQIHHALYDGWSFDLLLVDLDKVLRGLGSTPRPQFRDVSRYYIQRQQASASEADRLYWADLLHNYVPTKLINYNGTTRIAPTLQSHRGYSAVNPRHLSERAKSLALNPQVFFQAALGYILELYTGSPDVVFGNVTSGRTIPITGIEELVGPCIATLPCRLDFEALPTVHEVLKKTQNSNRDSLRHCTLSLRDIAKAAGVRPGTQLFDVLFVWQQSSSSDDSSCLIAKVVDSADDLEFKLTIEFEPHDNYISFRATFDPSAIPEKQIKYLSRQIDEVVNKFLDDTHCTMDDVGRCFTTPSLAIANPEPSQSRHSVSLSHAVEKWAHISPDKEAIIFGHVSDGAMTVKHTTTYSLLNSRANQLARLLAQHGVGQDQLVCIIMEKSIDLYVAILAVLKLGSGYLPLVPDTPVERVNAILKDAQVTICVSDSLSSASLRESFSGTPVNMDLADLSSFPAHNLDTPYNGSHIAYAVFTSGSTGTPKGVLVTQQNLMSNLEYLSGVYPNSTDSRILQSCSQAFDVSVFEIFYAWHVGMPLCTATKEDLFRDLEASINVLGVTHLSLTPTVAALVNPDNVPKVEFLVTAGEALTEHVRRQWAGRGLYQGYGPSETTNICTVRPSVTSTDLINNIGAPFDNTSAFVLDPSSDTILPRGAVGELCFGGEQVFRGYLNRPELNATKLISIAPYDRIYRSGDMGRLLPDDCILSTGRSDDQVKIRGQRVELGEITSIVLDEDDVADCTTLLLSKENGVKVLVNFWVPRDCSSEHFKTLDAKFLRSIILRVFAVLSRQLPVYMVPSYLVPISRIPMTAQAKIDKRLLQANFVSLSDTELMQLAPAHNANGETNDTPSTLSDWEKKVAEVLANILQISVEGIRRSSSFFHLGLDSVSAIRFCNALRWSGLGDFTVSTVLKDPTISHLDTARAKQIALPGTCKFHIGNVEDVFTEDQKSQIRATYDQTGLSVGKIYPCTPLQEAMLASSSSSEAAYSNTMIFEIKGDVDRLQACWKLAQRRHDILRTSFITTDHPNYSFAQVVLKDIEIQCGQADTLHNVQSRMDTILSELLASHKPPLYLAVHKSGASTKLIFSCHHALYDGIAIAALLMDVQQAYFDYTLRPAIPYDRYLQHMVSQDLIQADKFWSRQFADFKPTYFPDLTGRVHNLSEASKIVKRDMQLPLSVIRAASQRTSVSVLSMVQASWAKLLHFYTGENDLCFGNVVSGRALPEDGLDTVVAPCFNTLPVRARFEFRKTNLHLVELLHSFNVESLAYQLTPLRRIQGFALKDGGRLFDTLVILQQSSEPLDDSLWILEEDMGKMDFPVVCEVHQDDQADVLRLSLHYNTSLLSDADAQIAAETFDNNLSDVIRHSDAAADDFIGFPPTIRAEANMVFTRLNSNSDLLHTAFEENAVSQPDSIALDFLCADGRRTAWSFAILNLKANHIAHKLIQHGVGLEDIIPIHMSKSPMFYASILGVLKAGAAFAPVHPDLPGARKKLMLEELNPKVMLCIGASSFTTQMSTVIFNVEEVEWQTTGICENPSIQNLTGSNLAYCIYTSGSTGVPKAVSMEHQAPIQTVESSRSLVPWNTSSRLLQYAAVTFDMCYYDCFLAWTFGFTLCAAEQHLMFDNLPHVINSLSVTLLDLTPSVAASLSRSQVSSVQWLYCIGEAMSADVAREWAGACVNSYGPTEAAFCTTMYPMSEDMKTSIIGRPYPSTSFAVFSAQRQRPLPLLSVGELYIGGSQLARGYFGRSELTNERFVTKSGQRFYKSGDIVRMLSDGNFEFIGRADDQVKIRGLRVELGEINHVLQDCDARIKSVVTQILKKDAKAKEQLVAFFVTRSRADDNEREELRKKAIQTAKARLPTYMIPQFCIFVDSMPRSMAGKVDKQALARIFEADTTVNETTNGVGDSHKWTEIELHIRSVLSKLSETQMDVISPNTTIYQLGLDSISAVQIAATLRKRGYDVSASDVMRFTNCVDLAEHLQKKSLAIEAAVRQFDFSAFDKKHRETLLESCGLKDQLVEAILPCTPLQQGMVSQFVAKDGSFYYNYLRLHLNNDIDVGKLKNAWAKTMRHHPILRTGFAQVKDEQFSFAMVQFTSDAVSLPWFEGSNNAAKEWLGHLQRRALGQLHQPMWHLRLISDDEELYLDLAIFHALFDAHSLQLIFNDVVAIYKDQPPKATSCLETVLSELLQLSKSQGGSTERFWTSLREKTVPSRFPNMTSLRHEPAPPVVLERYSSMSVTDIENGCRAANITLQAAGIASWSSILSAYTGEPTGTIGVVLSGRTTEAANDAAFPCINTIPFPLTVTDNRVDNIQAVMALNADLHQHQFTPLNKIHRLMGLPNEPLFDSIFAYQKTASRTQQNELWAVQEEMATTEYPISIELEVTQGMLKYRLTCLPQVIPPQQARLILEQLDHIMRSYIFPNETSATESFLNSSLYSITPAKEATLSSEVKLLHEFVEFTADDHPDRIAFEFTDSISEDHLTSRNWTYRQLDAEGNRIAYLLLSHHVKQGSLVGVCFDKCPEASFAILGILKAGCAFVAIDPSAPSARQAFIIEDSGAQVVLSMSAQSAKFSEDVDAPVLNLDKVATNELSATRPHLERSVDPQDRSYCLYTSGTTGTPKGCELTHENAVQAMLAFKRLFAGHWDEESRWLQFASFHFDVSVLEQYWSWSVGICVVSAPRDLIFEDIANSIRTLNITHIDLTPSLAQILHPDDVPSLCKGVFITGGESLKQEILDIWGPKSVIYNGYGPTEATIGCTMYPRVPANGKPSNIGPQFDNVGSYVLKPGSDAPVLRGGVGELCVSGKLVGKGYLNRPELTEERFAYLDRFAERVYRTGDLVRILHDGTFDFLGRADDQVKLRGQRLEIGEINSVIRQSNKDFTDVATLVLKHPKQQKEQLVAFVVVGDKSSREPTILVVEASRLAGAKEACHDRLPPYMVPTHFIPLASMPLNANNKADGKRLKQIYDALPSKDLQQLSATANGSDATWSKQEEKLRHVLAEALSIGKEAIDKDSSFYELGMDSISVIGVSRALKLAGFPQVTPTILMRYSTIGRLAKVLSASSSIADNSGSLIAAQQVVHATQHRHRRAVAQSLGVDSGDIEALAPCTPLQQGMIARSLDSDDGLYFNTFAFKLNDDIDIPRLRFAWEEVSKSTQILRTSFVNTDDGYVQAIIQGSPLPWGEQKVTRYESMPDILQKLRQSWLEENQTELDRPFKLDLVSEAGALLLVVHIFHGLYDGNSIELLFEEVRRVYEGLEAVVDDVPKFHEALVHGPLRLAEGAKKFWEGHLTDLTPRSLPSLTEGLVQGTVVVIRDLDPIPAYDSTRRNLNVTAQAIAQACWIHTLQQYAHFPITTGLVVSGRNLDLEGADQVIGPMFNTIPYQHHTQAGDTWASVIARVHDFNTAALPYQHTSLRDIMKWCKRSPNQPLFDTLFVYQVAQTEKDQWRNNAAWELQDSDAVADYPLAIEIEQKSEDRFKLTLVTQGHVSNTQTSNKLLDRFEDALRNALADPSAVLEATTSVDDSNQNGRVEPHYTSNGLDATTNFDWSGNAVAIQEEIASLTGTDIIQINELTSIFELGLDSIDAIKLSSRLKKRGVDLAVSGIMRGLIIKNMVKNISSAQATKTQSQVSSDLALHKQGLRDYVKQHGIDLSEIDNVLPLTPLQEAMVAEMVASDYTRYYNFDVSELATDTDIDRLRNAWHTVIESSPILRTSFIEVDDPQFDGSFVQIVIKQRPFDLWTQWKKIDAEETLDFPTIFEDLRCVAVQSKALEPPVKITLLKTPGKNYQILSIAHALYDGWSLGLLHDAVNAAYRRQFVPRPNYEATLADILSCSGSDAVMFWQDYLTGLKPSLFPRRHACLTEETNKVHRKKHTSDIQLFDIIAFAKSSKVSLQALGQTVFALTLASYVGSLDVTFGCVLSGRDDDLRSQLLFPIMNTVTIRTVLHGSRLETLQYVQDNFSNIKQWQHYPLRKVSALAGAQGKLFDSLFIYQKSVEEGSSTEKRLYTSVEGQSDVEYPVCVEMEVVNGELEWRCAVKEEVLSLDGAQLLLGRLDKVLRNIIQHADEPTINSTSQGVSVCSLPAFKEKHMPAQETMDNERQSTSAVDVLFSETATKIREALAFVSQISKDDITRDMNIFHIGLDSISAIKVSSILRKQGIILSVGEMLKAGTVEKMAELVDVCTTPAPDHGSKLDASIKEALHGLNQENALSQTDMKISQVKHFLPITAGQLYMLSMWLNTKGTNFYPEFLYTLEGSVNRETLRNSWQALVSANPILRTRIIATDQSDFPYIQAVLREANASLTYLTGQNDETAIRTMDNVIKQQPWVHLFLTQTSTGWKLTLRIHHALYDGVSLPLLMQQFQDLCNGAPCTSPKNTFDKYIAIAHTHSALSIRKAFWTKYLEGIKSYYDIEIEPALKLKTEVFKPSLIQTSTLEVTARQHGVSTQALFLATYAKLHAARASLADTEDVVVGIYLASRSFPIDELPTSAIPTVNCLPLCVCSPLSTSTYDAATQIQKDLQKINDPVNATASLFEISEWTGVRVDTFVNFLSLPDTDYDKTTQGKDEIEIKQKQGWQEAVSRVIELENRDAEVPRELLNKRVNAAYLHAIDVEATIRNGNLDVGVFAPTGLLSLEDGEKLVEDVRLELENFGMA